MSDSFYDPTTVQCPYPHYRTLRRDDPVHLLAGEDVFLITRYADCEQVLARPDVFSNKVGPGLRQQALMGAAKAPGDAAYRVVRTLLTNDPPSHTRYRRLVSRAFTVRRVAELQPKIRSVVDSLIDGLPTAGQVDLVEHLAQPLPLVVIADFLGVPRSDLDVFRIWSDDAAEVLGGTLDEERSVECYRSLQELLGYFDQRVSERRLQPSDDFLGLLLEARTEEDRPLQTEEMLAISYVTLVAGNETTVNLLSSLLLLLLSHPDTWERVVSDRTLIPRAVEEALRLEAPVQGSVRIATEDTEIGGTPIPRSSRVLIVSGAANRDPEVFPEPDVFDLDRNNARQHLSFGKGIHFCLGAPLSRLEATVALEQLVNRIEHVALAPDFEASYADNAVLRSLRRLPVDLTRTNA